MKRIKVGPGAYESSAGHKIDRIKGRWFVTFPGAVSPDVARSTLREAWEYVATEPVQ